MYAWIVAQYIISHMYFRSLLYGLPNAPMIMQLTFKIFLSKMFFLEMFIHKLFWVSIAQQRKILFLGRLFV